MGETYILDTSVCSKYIQGFLSDKAADLMDTILEDAGIVSLITRIELLSWVTLSKTLDEDVRIFISEVSIIDVSEPIIIQTIRLRRHYKGLKLPDAIIAATAIVNKFTLLSTNNVDFERIADLKYKSLSN